MKLNKNTMLVLGGFGLALAWAMGSKKSGAPMGTGPQLTTDERGRLQAGLTALRNLVTAQPRHRRDLILAFQLAAQIPATGVLDPLTMEAAQAATTNQVDQDAIMVGLRSLIPAKSAPTSAPEHEPTREAPSIPQTQTSTASERVQAPQSPAVAPQAPASSQAQSVQALAELATRNIELAGSGYNRQTLLAFQKRAIAAGLYPKDGRKDDDGSYGPRTRNALIAAGIEAKRLPVRLGPPGKTV